MSEEVERKLKKIFSRIFPHLGEVDLKKDRNSFENWDSLNHLQLVSEIETSFAINLEVSEIADIEKGDDFIPLILEKSKK